MADITIKTALSPSGEVRISVCGDTRKYKEVLKSIGYRWGKTPESLSIMDFSESSFCWYKYIEKDALTEETEKLKKVSNKIEKDNNAYNKIYVKFSMRENFVITENITPNWNGRVYEKDGEYHIFCKGKKIPVSNKEAEELKSDNPQTEIIKKYGLKRKEKNDEN